MNFDPSALVELTKSERTRKSVEWLPAGAALVGLSRVHAARPGDRP
jgi:hypothetical protein